MKDTIKDLTEGMQRLCAVANRIVAQQGSVSRIEADLLLEDLRHLYDVALRLTGDALPTATPSPVEEPEAEPKVEEKMMAMMSTLAAMAPQPEAPAPVEAKEPIETIEPMEAIAPEAAVEEAPVEEAPAEQPLMEELEDNGNALLFDEIVIEEKPTEPIETIEPIEPIEEPVKPVEPVEPAPKAQQASLLDYLNQPVATVWEQQEKAPRTLGETLVATHHSETPLEKKVDDLRTVININDKFSFMSELFKGNMKAYNDFILRLNATELRDEALAHVHEVAAQYKWDEGSAAVNAFYKIFDKKF